MRYQRDACLPLSTSGSIQFFTDLESLFHRDMQWPGATNGAPNGDPLSRLNSHWHCFCWMYTGLNRKDPIRPPSGPPVLFPLIFILLLHLLLELLATVLQRCNLIEEGSVNQTSLSWMM